MTGVCHRQFANILDRVAFIVFVIVAALVFAGLAFFIVGVWSMGVLDDATRCERQGGGWSVAERRCVTASTHG